MSMEQTLDHVTLSSSAMSCWEFFDDMMEEDIDELEDADEIRDFNTDAERSVMVPKSNLRNLWKHIFRDLDDYLDKCVIDDGYPPVALCEEKYGSLLDVCYEVGANLEIFEYLGLIQGTRNAGHLISMYVDFMPSDEQEKFYRTLASQKESLILLMCAVSTEYEEDFFGAAELMTGEYYGESGDPAAARDAFKLWKEAAEEVRLCYPDELFIPPVEHS